MQCDVFRCFSQLYVSALLCLMELTHPTIIMTVGKLVCFTQNIVWMGCCFLFTDATHPAAVKFLAFQNLRIGICFSLLHWLCGLAVLCSHQFKGFHFEITFSVKLERKLPTFFTYHDIIVLIQADVLLVLIHCCKCTWYLLSPTKNIYKT